MLEQLLSNFMRTNGARIFFCFMKKLLQAKRCRFFYKHRYFIPILAKYNVDLLIFFPIEDFYFHFQHFKNIYF